MTETIKTIPSLSAHTVNRRKAVVGTFLKQLRIEKNVSLQKAGKRLGLSSGQFVWNWENGRSLPPLRYIKKLARLYGIRNLTIRKMVYRLELIELKEKWGF